MMLMVGSVMCHRRERETDSQSEPDSGLGHSLSPRSADLHGLQDRAPHPRGLLALGACYFSEHYCNLSYCLTR